MILSLLALIACDTKELPEPPDDTGETLDVTTDDTGEAPTTTDDTEPGVTDDTGTPADTDTDTSVTDGGVAPQGVQAELAEDVQTVVRVWWSTEEASSGYVRYWEDGSDRVYETNLTAEGVDHEVLLIGMPSEAVVRFEAVAVTDAERASSTFSITTGYLPSQLPSLYPTGATDSWDDFIVMPIEGTINATVIIDDQGRYVWYDVLEGEGNLMRAFLSADRQWMVYCFAGPQSDLSQGRIVRVSLDGATTEETAAPYIDHDMVGLPDGSVAAIVVTPYSGSDPALSGSQADQIVEFHPDGSTTVIWDAWEAFPDAAEPSGNWTHGNGLDYDPDTDTYTISLKTMTTIAHIDRATGENLWVLGGSYGEFSYVGGAEPLELHHQFELLESSILIFDNGSQGRGYSRAVEYEMDMDAMEVSLSWEYVRDPPIYVYAKGDVVRFEDGVTQVVWSTGGQIQDVSPTGEVGWQLDTDLGSVMTFIDHVDDFYVRE